MVNDGIAYSFGIILEPMRSDLDLSIGSVSLIGGALTGVTMLIGPVAAHSVNRCITCLTHHLCISASIIIRFGNQATCILGAVIASCSMYLSSFCSSFLTLFVTYGLLVGVGLGFVYVPAVVAVGEYFRDRLSFATGDFVSSDICFIIIDIRYLCVWVRSWYFPDSTTDVFLT